MSATIHAVIPALVGMGFRKRAGTVFTIDLVPGVLGWLGLNRATQHRAADEVEVNPVVGVRFQDVERLVADCRGEQFHFYQPPTISCPLGYLMPERKYKAWLFGPGRSGAAATEMASAIASDGVPFMRSVVDLGELRRRMRERMGFEHQLAYRRPVAALLAGEIDKALALLEDELSGLGTRDDVAAVEFRKFAEVLRRRISASSLS